MFTIIVSVLAILLGFRSNLAAFMMGGWAAFQNYILEGMVLTIVYLAVWLIYGAALGYTKKKGFMKFISLYWSIGVLNLLFASFIAPIGKLAIIVLPIAILTFVPTFGLANFYDTGTNSIHPYFYPMIIMLSSWSVGAIGYLIGFLLKKSKIACLGKNE